MTRLDHTCLADLAIYLNAGQSVPIFAADHTDTMPMNDGDAAAAAATLPTSPVPPSSAATDTPDTKRMKFQKSHIAVSDESLVPTPETPLPTGDSDGVPQEDCRPSTTSGPDPHEAPAAEPSPEEAPCKVLRMSLSSK